MPELIAELLLHLLKYAQGLSETNRQAYADAITAATAAAAPAPEPAQQASAF